MSIIRRASLARLAGLVATSALPRVTWTAASSHPLAGTIAANLAGLEAGDWTAAETTALALKRCRTDGAAWRIINALDPDTAVVGQHPQSTRILVRQYVTF